MIALLPDPRPILRPRKRWPAGIHPLRRRSPLVMVGGRRILDATGKRALDSLGRRRLDNDPSCLGIRCEFCADCCTPAKILVTFVDIVVSYGVTYSHTGGNPSMRIDSGDPNGTYCLTQLLSSICWWHCVVPGLFTGLWHNGVNSGTSIDLMIEFQPSSADGITGGVLNMFAAIPDTVGEPVSGPSLGLRNNLYFDDGALYGFVPDPPSNGGRPVPCSKVWGSRNINVIGAPDDPGAFGTALVTPNGC